MRRDCNHLGWEEIEDDPGHFLTRCVECGESLMLSCKSGMFDFLVFPRPNMADAYALMAARDIVSAAWDEWEDNDAT